MILRPVSPQSPWGPPTTKRPVVLMNILVSPSSMSAGSTFLITSSMMASLRVAYFTSGLCWAGHHHGLHPLGHAVFVLDGHLGLAVGAKETQGAVLAHLGQAPRQLVGVVDGRGHQLGGLGAGVAEHDALVAGPLLAEKAGLGGDALRDVGRLFVDAGEHRAGLPVKAHGGVGVADPLDGVAHDFRDVHVGVGGYLARHYGHTGGDQGFAGHAGLGVVLEHGIEYGVGDLIRHLVRVSLGH